MTILIAEDDSLTRDGLVDLLQSEGFATLPCDDGAQALERYAADAPDLVCLDVMMPGLSGFEVCKRIRQQDPHIPILFLTAKSEEADTVVGLDLGADDFIRKPFGTRELLARIRATLRRAAQARSASGTPERTTRFSLGDLEVIPDELRARRADLTIELSPRDVKILQLLHHEQGRAVPRDTFFERCWGFQYLPQSRSLDQHISQLRKRIELDPKHPAIIQTVHGIGYRYQP
jgi:DNA-binding response OmpR family regulator